MCKWFIALFLLLAASAGHAFPLINIGTKAGLSDIIYKNEARADYKRSADLITPLPPSKANFFSFFIEVDDASDTGVVVQKPFVFSLDRKALIASLNSWPESQLVKMKKEGKEGYQVDIANQCRGRGTTQVYVTMRMKADTTAAGAGDAKAFRKGAKVVSFSYFQNCDPEDKKLAVEVEEEGSEEETADDEPLMVGEEVIDKEGRVTLEEDGAGLRGLMVSTNPDGVSASDADVMKDGLATPGYEMVRGTSGALAITPAHEKASTYYVYTTVDMLDVYGAVVVSDDPTVVTAHVSGEMSEDRILMREEVLPFNVEFTCYKEGSSEIIISFTSPSQLDAKATFRVQKDCVGAEHEETFVEGLSIGLGKFDKEVMVEGRVTDLFTRPEQDGDHPLNTLYKVDAHTKSLDFHFSSVFRDPIGLKRPFMVTTDSHDAAVEVARPELSGSLLTTNQLSEGSSHVLTLTFNCVHSGLTDVTVKVPLAHSDGAITFAVQKVCPLSAHVDKPKEQVIRGLNIAIVKERIGPQHDNFVLPVVQNGLSVNNYGAHEHETDLDLITGPTLFSTFLLRVNVTDAHASPVRLGAPNVISSLGNTEPEISGPASNGYLVDKRHSASVTVTYHCVSNGTTKMTLVFPVLAASIDSVAPRSEPITITWLKRCTRNKQPIVQAMGGIGLPGFNIGLTKGGSEVVKNGFPLSLYYGKRNLVNPTWEAAIVKPDVRYSKFFVRYDYVSVQSAAGGRLRYGEPSVIVHNSVAAPTLSGYLKDRHNKVLLRGVKPQTLDLTWNCKYEGLAVATVVIPIYPHGKVKFTVPKQCKGATRPGGKAISGLRITSAGVSKDVKMVVDDGLTQDGWKLYKPEEWMEVALRTKAEEAVFEISNDGEDEELTTSGPLVFAHRPICNPVVEHSLPSVVVSETVDLVDGQETAAEIQADDAIDLEEAAAKGADSNAGRIQVEALDTQQSKISFREFQIPSSAGVSPSFRSLKVIHNCLWGGTTPVTVILPLSPRGQTSFTYTVECPEDDDVQQEAGLSKYFEDTYTYGDYSSEYDDDYSDYSSSDYDAARESQGASSSSSFASSSYSGSDSYSYSSSSYSYSDYDSSLASLSSAGQEGSGDDSYGSESSYYYSDSSYASSDEDWADWDEDRRNPDLYFSDASYSQFDGGDDDGATTAGRAVPARAEEGMQSDYYDAANQEVTGFLNVGSATLTLSAATGRRIPVMRKLDDVVKNGVPSALYSRTAKGATSDSATPFKIIPRKRSSVTFFVSVPHGVQQFDAPIITSKAGAGVAHPRLSGSAIYGGDVTSIEPLQLSVEFNCQAAGFVPMMVSIPLLPRRLGSVSFRFVKLCRNDEFVVHEDFYWTAPRVLSMIVVATLMALAAYAAHLFKNKKLLERLGDVNIDLEDGQEMRSRSMSRHGKKDDDDTLIDRETGEVLARVDPDSVQGEITQFNDDGSVTIIKNA